MTPLFEGRLEHMQARRAVIEADEGVREREMRKLAGLAELIDCGLRERGADELTATLPAHIAVTAFTVAVTCRPDQDGTPDLAAVVDETLDALRSLARELVE